MCIGFICLFFTISCTFKMLGLKIAGYVPSVISYSMQVEESCLNITNPVGYNLRSRVQCRREVVYYRRRGSTLALIITAIYCLICLLRLVIDCQDLLLVLNHIWHMFLRRNIYFLPLQAISQSKTSCS